MLGALALRLFPPWRYPIYPACPIRALTGWRCPGCGTTHALAAMLAGHWMDAWHYNPMAVVVYPPLAALAIVQICWAVRWNRWLSIFRRNYREPSVFMTR